MPTYTGNNGDNTINGGNGDDTISGQGGDDTLSGGNGDDTISGGSGEDTIDGGNGDDGIDGGTGDDLLDGGNGDDVINGGDDNDIIYGGNGGDWLNGGAGNDQLYGQNGDDKLTGGAGNDLLDGNNGFDIAYYSGPIGEYSFYSAAGYLHVVHLGGAGADGHDQLIRVERLVFADRVINIGSGNNKPVAGDDHVFITEDTGTYNSGAASVKDNDFDFDGDTLTVTGGTFVGTYGTLTLNANGTYSYTLNALAQGLDTGETVTDSFNYTITDNDGSDTGALVFHIAGVNDAPVANDDAASTNENTAVSGNVLANDTDVDVEPLTVANPGTYVGAYGTLVLAANGSYTYTPNAAANALDDGEVVSDTFGYTASDGTASDTATLTVTVTGLNDAPVANDDTAATTEEAAVSGNVLVNDTDVDVEPLTVTNPGTYVGTYGTLTLAADGSYTYTPSAAAQSLDDGEVVSDSFGYTVSDGTASDTATLTVNVAGLNDAPVANDDAASTTEDAAVSGNVLANDTDVDVEPLTVANAGTYVGAYGTLVLAADGSYTYTPNAVAQALDDGEVVSDSFGYTASDGTASDTATLTVTVTGLNDAPVANDDAAATTEDVAVSGNVLANDTDVDVEPLSVTNPGTYVGTYGTLTLAADGSYTYTPSAAAQGLDDGEVVSDAFSYTASDGTASDTATLTVSVSGLNDAPVANDDTAATTEDAAVAGNVLANDTDVDVEPLTVANPGTYAGAYGTLVLAADGSYTYTPNAAAQALDDGEVVSDSFGYTASDGTASDTATLTVTVTGLNDAPVANDDAASTNEDSAVTGNVLTNDTDVDVEPLTVTNPGTYVGTYGTLVLAADGGYTYTPNATANGLAAGEVAQDSFGYTASDGTASDTATLTVTVNGTNDAPTIDAGGTDASGSVTELPNNDPNENVLIHSDSGTVAFADVDVSDTHSASFTPQAGGYLGTFTLDPVDQGGDSVGWDFSVSDADLDFLDDGDTLTQTYTVQIDDGHGGTVTQDVTITLTGASDGPQTEWYIDNSAVGSANLGTEADPFTSIAAFNAAQGSVDGPQVGATVFLLAGTGTYAEADGLNLLDDQIVTGVASGPLRPTIVTTGGDGINVAQNNTISGLDVGNTSGADIADSGGTVGTLTITDVGTSGTGQIIDIDQGGTLNVTLNSAESTGSAGGAIDLNGVGGSFTVTGATTITGVHSGGGVDITGSSLAASLGGGGLVSTAGTTAVNFVGNSGSLALGGGLDIVTTSGAGLNASGGGTLTVTDAGNSIASTTGTALSVTMTNIGLAGLTFDSVSSNGAVNGIVLNSTGTTAGVNGGLTITGDAGSLDNGSGGTIANSTGVGVLLTNTRDVSLDQVVVQNGGDDGIRGTTVTNFTLTNSTVFNDGNALQEHGADFTNLLGNGTFTNVTFSNNETSQVSIVNTTGTASVAFTGLTASSTGLASSPNGLHGLNFETQGTASADLTVLDSTFDNLFSNSINALNSGTGTLEMTVANSEFLNTGASAINLVQSSSGATRFYIHDNPTFLRGVNNGVSAAININQTTAVPAGAVLEGAISDNVIGNNTSSTSATTGGDGIRILSTGAGTTTVRVDGNDIQGVGGNGISLQMSGSNNAAHTMNATLFDNVVSATDVNSFDGIRVIAGAASGNAGVLRLDMHDNDASSTFGNDFQVRQRFATTVQLLNYGGAATDLAAVQNYFDNTRANDPLGPGTDWFLSTQAPGGGFQNTASVPQPTLPTPLLASGPAAAGGPLGDDAILSQADADSLLHAAIQRWADAGATVSQLAAMRAVTVSVGDMAGLYLGSSHDGVIRLDADGAGHGWFVDTTPGDDSEFVASAAGLVAAAGGAADGRIDALTAIVHELGHQIGLEDVYGGSESGVMDGVIDAGVRVLPDSVFGADSAALSGDVLPPVQDVLGV